MKPTLLIARATTDDGGEMTLHEHDGDYTIRIDGVELMSTRQHLSEERMAELACAHLRQHANARVLIGGLGMGFTLRASLAVLAPDARVTVVELMPAVIAWNRTPAYGLAADALNDPRVEVVQKDVATVLRASRGVFDAVMLDVDNGADGLTVARNDRLYRPQGLAIARDALSPKGRLAVWSATNDPAFVERMRAGGFTVTTERVAAYPGGRVWNWVFLGKRAAGVF